MAQLDPVQIQRSPLRPLPGLIFASRWLQLPADRREVLVLSRYEYKTYDEIATVLECSVGAVKVRVHRAMKQLREIYLEMSGEVTT